MWEYNRLLTWIINNVIVFCVLWQRARWWSGSQRGIRAKERLLTVAPPRCALRDKCGSQEKQPFTDRYWALPLHLSNQQTIGQFCPFLSISLTSSSDHDAVTGRLFIWLISCKLHLTCSLTRFMSSPVIAMHWWEGNLLQSQADELVLKRKWWLFHCFLFGIPTS